MAEIPVPGGSASHLLSVGFFLLLKDSWESEYAISMAAVCSALSSLDRASGLSRYAYGVGFILASLSGCGPRARSILPTCYRRGSCHSRFVPGIAQAQFQPQTRQSAKETNNKGRFSIPALSLACSVAGALRFDSWSKTGATL